MLSDGQLLTAEVRRRPQFWDPGHREYVNITSDNILSVAGVPELRPPPNLRRQQLPV